MEDYLHKNKLKLVPDRIKGRNVVTTVDLPAGTLVFASSPLATVSVAKNVCNSCLRAATLVRCSACKRASYCGPQCQKQDWTAGHSKLCKLWKGRSEAIPLEQEKDEEMLVKIRTALARPHPDINGVQEAYQTLGGHDEILSDRDRAGWKTLADRIGSLMGVDGSILFADLLRFRSNNFSIHTGELFVVGEGTYPLGALLNHSCHPNCSVLYDAKNRQVVRTTRDVKAGEELCGTYVDGMESREGRKALLQERYGFACRCERCNNDGSFGRVDSLLGAAQEASTPDEQKVIETWLSSASQIPKVQLANSLQRIIAQSLVSELADPEAPSLVRGEFVLLTFIRCTLSHMSPSLYIQRHPPATYQTRHSALVQALSQWTAGPKPFSRSVYSYLSRHFNATLDSTPSPLLALYILSIYLLAYEQFHPMIGIQALLAAKLCWNSEEDASLVRVLVQMALEIVRNSHGDVGHLLEDATELWRIVDSATSKQGSRYTYK